MFHSHCLLLQEVISKIPQDSVEECQLVMLIWRSLSKILFGAWWEKNNSVQVFGTVTQDAIWANGGRFGQMNMLSHISTSISMKVFSFARCFSLCVSGVTLKFRRFTVWDSFKAPTLWMDSFRSTSHSLLDQTQHQQLWKGEIQVEGKQQNIPNIFLLCN